VAGGASPSPTFSPILAAYGKSAAYPFSPRPAAPKRSFGGRANRVVVRPWLRGGPLSPAGRGRMDKRLTAPPFREEAYTHTQGFFCYKDFTKNIDKSQKHDIINV